MVLKTLEIAKFYQLKGIILLKKMSNLWDINVCIQIFQAVMVDDFLKGWKLLIFSTYFSYN